MWIKNTGGRPDAMLTFAFFSFIVVTLNMFLSTFGMISIGDFTMTFHTLDSSVMAVYLGATFTAYVSRRWTDKKYEVNVSVPGGNQYDPYSPYTPDPNYNMRTAPENTHHDNNETLDSSIDIPGGHT